MNVKQVAVTYGRKLNLGNYQSANLEIQLVADIEPDEDPIPVAARLWDMAKAEVKAQALPLVGKSPPVNAEQFFAGLPVEGGK